MVLQAQLKKRMHFQGQVGGFNTHFGQGAGFPRNHGPHPQGPQSLFGSQQSDSDWQQSGENDQRGDNKKPKGWSHPEIE